ncbi:MAG: hypothetical protein ACT4OS_04835 [Acidimicrobiales bacterium]
MTDAEVLEALVSGGARRAFGPTLHIEGDCLFFDGWWQAAFRIAPTTYAIRDEDPPGETTVLDDVVEALGAKGLVAVPANASQFFAITYTEIALGLVMWKFMSTDLETADTALAARAGHDAFLNDYDNDNIKEADYSAELGGARRNAGLPPSIILTVGISPDRVAELAASLEGCRIESRAMGEIRPEACGSLIPTLVVVDTTVTAGAEFAMELRAAACGRFIPLVAMANPEQGTPLGADAAVAPAAASAAWAETIHRLLP